jgi:tetratricopeptide (TPR) repeat protein
LAELEFLHRDVEKAIEIVDRAIALLPDAPDASTCYNNRSAYFIALDRWDEAIASAAVGLALARRHGVGVDIAFALQRFAAIAALHSRDFSRAARVIGYVDARIHQLQGVRQFTELQEFERIDATLRAALGASDFEHFAKAGAASSEADLLREVEMWLGEKASSSLG